MARARREGMVRTITGRRRLLRGIAGGDARARAQAERMAINTPIQGSAADLIKQAMLEVERRLRERGLRTRMILQVHDELVLEAPESEASEVAQILREAMESADLPLLRRVADERPSLHGPGSVAAPKLPPVPVREPPPDLFTAIPAEAETDSSARLLVPLSVDLGRGANWDEAHG